MANRLQKQPVLSYVPAVPAVPGRAAYCEIETVITGYRLEASGGSTFVSIDSLLSGNGGVSVPASASPVYRQVYNPASGGYQQQLVGWLVTTNATSRRVPIYQTIETCYPAQPAVAGVPARMDIYQNLGWSAGARSIAEVPEGSYLQVRLPERPYGVMVGLSDGRFDHTYGHAAAAVVARPSGVTPVSYGSDLGAEQALGEVVQLIRHGAGVRMVVDGVVVHDTSVPLTGQAYADVTLYAANDYVDDPVIAGYHETGAVAGIALVSAYAEAAGGIAAVGLVSDAVVTIDGVALTGGAASVQLKAEVQAHARYEVGGVADLSASMQLAGYVYADADGAAGNGVSYGHARAGFAGKGTMGLSSTALPMYGQGIYPVPRSSGRLGRPEAMPLQAVGIYPSGLGRGLMKVVRKMQGSGVAGAVGKGAERAFMGGASPVATQYKPIAWWSYLPAWMLDAGQMMVALDQIQLQGGALFVVAESLRVGDLVDVFLIVNFEIDEFVGVRADLPLSYIVQMAIDERLRVSSSAADARREALQYAVNAVTGALSEYRNFGFKQFARMGGETYAITDAGLYRLGAEGDAGETINAMIDFGASDFGTARSKRINSVYAGIATDGEVYLRVTGDDGKEAIYKAVGDGVERRARTAKGVTARHWRLRLELVDAVYADLDNVEIELGVSQRRLRR